MERCSMSMPFVFLTQFFCAVARRWGDEDQACDGFYSTQIMQVLMQGSSSTLKIPNFDRNSVITVWL